MFALQRGWRGEGLIEKCEEHSSSRSINISVGRIESKIFNTVVRVALIAHVMPVLRPKLVVKINSKRVGKNVRPAHTFFRDVGYGYDYDFASSMCLHTEPREA